MAESRQTERKQKNAYRYHADAPEDEVCATCPHDLQGFISIKHHVGPEHKPALPK
jgi:hypothetical protein